MKPALATTLTLVLAAPSLAQTYSYSPRPFYDTKAGEGVGGIFGAYAEQRFQLVDSNLGSLTRSISEIAFRRQFRRQDDNGRTWKQVTLDVAPAATTRTATFSTNAAGTPTRVFAGSVSWASPTTPPTSRLDPWSLRFQFRSPYVHLGKNDLLVDFTMTGGTLHNSKTWYYAPLYMDSFRAKTYSYAAGYRMGELILKGGCRNRGPYSGLTPMMVSTIYAYGPTYATTSYRNKFNASIKGLNLDPNMPAFAVVGFKPDPRGTAWPGINCGKLHVDLSLPYLTYPMRVSHGGCLCHIYLGTQARGLSPFNKKWVGIPIVSQALWPDPKDGALKLTNAIWTHVPDLPLTDDPTKVGMQSISAPTNASTGIMKTGDGLYAMLARYKN